MVRATLLVLGVLFLGSCVPANGPETVAVTAADSGRTFAMRVGDELVVTLDGNPSTGFDWEIATAPAVLTPTERVVTATGGALGAPVTVTYRFAASSAGRATLVLAYRRSWETVAPARVVELRLEVSAP
ncbi:MAG TPA: protease inhibitor I42 family protein [Candidatus Limnocylindria bacterium]|nr:protease inhibitor I42 family protein [Candidatus Limnocylindria bacterium]